MPFTLDPRFDRDSRLIYRRDQAQIRLQNHAPVPWLIVVPECEALELIDLDPPRHAAIQSLIDHVALTLRAACQPDKLNIASIGNVVPQLHIHVIGRYRSDPHWPNVVWGQASTPYDDIEREVSTWRERFAVSD